MKIIISDIDYPSMILLFKKKDYDKTRSNKNELL